MIVFEEPDMAKPNFVPCSACGKPRVLKVGDYCTACALETNLTASEHEYIILSPATMDIAADRSGITREFLAAKMGRAFENYQHYIIYNLDGEWRDVLVSDMFYIPTVMKGLFKRTED